MALPWQPSRQARRQAGRQAGRQATTGSEEGIFFLSLLSMVSYLGGHTQPEKGKATWNAHFIQQEKERFEREG